MGLSAYIYRGGSVFEALAILLVGAQCNHGPSPTLLPGHPSINTSTNRIYTGHHSLHSLFSILGFTTCKKQQIKVLVLFWAI